MNKGKRNIRICLVCMLFLAVLVGLFYYYYEMQQKDKNLQGTLITQLLTGPAKLWQK